MMTFVKLAWIFTMISVIYTQDRDVCMTRDCVTSAAHLINNIDVSVDPCTDFHGYACGNFVKEEEIPDLQYHSSVFSNLKYEYYKNLRNMMKRKSKVGEPDVYTFIKDFYTSCTHFDKADFIEDVKKVIKQLGGWPLLGDSFDYDTFQWGKLIGKAYDIGLTTPPLIFIILMHDPRGDGLIRVEKDENIDIEYDENDIFDINPYIEQLKTATTTILADVVDEDNEAVVSNADVDITEDSEQVQAILLLEESVINLKSEELKEEEILYTLEEFQTQEESNWSSIVNKYQEDAKVDDKTSVLVSDPNYLNKLENLFNSVDKKTVANYLVWKYVQFMFRWYSKYQKFLAVEDDMHKQRAEKCGRLIVSQASLQNGIMSMYSDQYLPLEDKMEADSIMENINSSFVEMLNNMKDRQDISIERDINMISKLKPLIGYAKEVRNTDLLNQFYSGLQVTSSTGFLRNNLNFQKFKLQAHARQLKYEDTSRLYDSNILGLYLEQMEPRFSGFSGFINIPAASLSSPVFKNGRPGYLNYGSLGAAIGSSIATPLFDVERSALNSEESTKTFKKCFSDQITNFTSEVIDNAEKYDVKSDSELLKPRFIRSKAVKDMAGLTGLQIALRSYKRYVESSGSEEASLPGLSKLSPRQLFWLSAVSSKCKVTYESDYEGRRRETSLFTKLHVNSQIRNLAEFAEDWKCPEGSYMNIRNKCHLW